MRVNHSRIRPRSAKLFIWYREESGNVQPVTGRVIDKARCSKCGPVNGRILFGQQLQFLFVQQVMLGRIGEASDPEQVGRCFTRNTLHQPHGNTIKSTHFGLA